jgi:hypothetical protein
MGNKIISINKEYYFRFKQFSIKKDRKKGKEVKKENKRIHIKIVKETAVLVKVNRRVAIMNNFRCKMDVVKNV